MLPVAPDAHLAPCPQPVEPNDDLGWLGREPTLDEQEIVEWLRARRLRTRILHVGVGNALLSSAFGSCVIQGITKDGAEARNAESIGLATILCNKYDVESYAARLARPFDLIVDANIRSYACCDRHFFDYLSLMHDTLEADGIFVTSQRGLDYLVPTSVEELRKLTPSWRVRKEKNVIVMRPRPRARLQKWFAARGNRNEHVG